MERGTLVADHHSGNADIEDSNIVLYYTMSYI